MRKDIGDRRIMLSPKNFSEAISWDLRLMRSLRRLRFS